MVVVQRRKRDREKPEMEFCLFPDSCTMSRDLHGLTAGTGYAMKGEKECPSPGKADMVRDPEKGERQTIRGIVVPFSWNEAGEVVDVAIDTREEKRYHVDRSGTGTSLPRHVRSMVEATGTVRLDDAGNMTIRVESFTLEKMTNL